MSDEVQIAGVEYVSSKRASQVSGYAQDYIGQLCRSGLIQAQRIGGMWYITLDSLYRYKQKADSYVPTAPRRQPTAETESFISFDGKDYISATRAAEITGYHQDYVGQLARESKMLSRQVGNRWYVDRAGIVAHKKEKDALLAAVQVEAVGLSRPSRNDVHPETLGNTRYNGAGPYLTYTSDEGDLLPLLSTQEDFSDVPYRSESFSLEARVWGAEHRVPIRVLESDISSSLREKTARSESEDVMPLSTSRSRGLKPILSWVPAALATIVIVLTIGYVSIANSALYAQIRPESASALAARASEAISLIGDILEGWLAPEIVYRRSN